MTTSLGDLQMWIDGEWVEARSGARVGAVSPATGEEIATVPDGDRADSDAAMDAATAVADRLLWTTPTQRSAFCHRIADEIGAREEELTIALTLDQGKPLSEARMEAKACAHFYRQAAEDILRLNGETFHSSDPNKRILSFYQARGPRGTSRTTSPRSTSQPTLQPATRWCGCQPRLQPHAASSSPGPWRRPTCLPARSTS